MVAPTGHTAANMLQFRGTECSRNVIGLHMLQVQYMCNPVRVTSDICMKVKWAYTVYHLFAFSESCITDTFWTVLIASLK